LGKHPDGGNSTMASKQGEDEGRDFVTVTQLAEELGVTARAIRFYEDKGLIKPQRLGATRVYTRREQARMKLILRGKRLGFSLREIAEFLDLYDADTTKRTQMSRLIERVRRRAADLEEQRAAITQTLAELAELEQQAQALLQSPARESAPKPAPKSARA
jgi:DNA-binding transcriptional MerR regulator